MTNRFGSFATPTKTVAFGTAFASLIPPWRGSGADAIVHSYLNGKLNVPKAYTHVTKAIYEAAGTAHDLVLMRPFNYGIVSADVAINTATFVLTDDPGVYSTNYKYVLPGSASGVPGNTANNAIAAGDYVAYQLRDGTWVLDTVASGTYAALVLTTTIPNVTGGGVAAGTLMYFFGVAANVDPATGLAHASFRSVASARTNLLGDAAGGEFCTLHQGDPIVAYSANATATGLLISCGGYYTNA